MTDLNLIINEQSIRNLQMSNYYIQKIMNSLINNNLYIDTDIFNIIERNNLEILYLNKKRNFEQSIFYNSFNNISPNKEVNFTIHKKNEGKSEANNFITGEEGIKNLSEQSGQSAIYNNYKTSYIEMQRLIETEKLFKNLINKNFETQNQNTKNNNILKDEMKKQIINNKKEEKINPDPIPNDVFDKINAINSNQNNIFNITNIRCNYNGVEKKSDKLESSEKKNCHEIKVMKNNKVVYINSNLSNSFLAYKNLEKLNKINLKGRGKRGSKYRGVSRNGSQWQVLIMLHKNKSYVGTYSSEEIAARIYDILAIKNRGVKAKTNFIYNEQQIKKICNNEIDIKSKNIKEVIFNLIKEDKINNKL